MDVNSIIQQMHKELQDQRNEGASAIQIDAVISNLQTLSDAVSADVYPPNIERLKAKLQEGLVRMELDHKSNLESFQATIQFSKEAVRYAFLLNGGACIAVLGVLAGLASKEPDRMNSFAGGLPHFAVGVLMAAAAASTTYLAQAHFTVEDEPSYVRPDFLDGNGYQFISVILVILAYLVFAFGTWSTYRTAIGI
jgi:hypothetical protein